MQIRDCIINSRKFDGRISRSWKCDLVSKNGTLLQFLGIFDRDIRHPELGFIRRGTFSYEYYWLDRWYNVFRFHEPDGVLRNYYCNINMPPQFADGVLDYVDLDIDVLVGTDFEYTVLDIDEFNFNAGVFGYGEDIVTKAKDTLDLVVANIKSRAFPFDTHL